MKEGIDAGTGQSLEIIEKVERRREKIAFFIITCFAFLREAHFLLPEHWRRGDCVRGHWDAKSGERLRSWDGGRWLTPGGAVRRKRIADCSLAESAESSEAWIC